METDNGTARPASGLELAAPIALLSFSDGDDGTVIDANELALTLLATERSSLLLSPFGDRLYGDDSILLAEALKAAGPEPSAPVLLRWGTTAPATYLLVRLQRQPDGSVVASMENRTDQYRLDTLLCGQGAGVFTYDIDGISTWISPLTEVVLGIPPSAIVGTQTANRLHPDDVVEHERTTEELHRNPGVPIIRSCRYSHPLIGDTWWRVRQTRIHMPDDPAVGGTIARIELMVDDPNEEDPSTGGQSQMTMADMMPAGMIMAAGDRVSFRNNQARHMLGTAIESSDPHRWVQSLRVKHRRDVHALLDAAVDRSERGTTTAALDRKGQSTLWIRIEAMPAVDGAGRTVGYCATLLDVTSETEARQSLQQAQEQLWALANQDPLTGLPNRMQFTDRLSQALVRKQRDDQEVAVLFCDVDHFKPVNDQHGHHIGDEVLVAVGHRLAETSRGSDTVCRIGGDEFVVICQGFSDTAGPQILADRLIEAVAKPIEIEGVIVEVGLSVGIAFAAQGEDPDDLVSRADTALYDAKRAGRGRVITAT